MSYSVIRSAACPLVLLASLTSASAAQTIDAADAVNPPTFASPDLELSLPYDGRIQWEFDAQGRPMRSSSAPELRPATVYRKSTSPFGNHAPVVPARPTVHHATQDPAANPSPRDGADLAIQQTEHADSSSWRDKADTDSGGPMEWQPGWTDQALEKVGSCTEAVVGRWNWLRLEAQEAVRDRMAHTSSDGRFGLRRRLAGTRIGRAFEIE